MPAELVSREDGLDLVVEYEPAPVVKDFIEDPTFVTGLVGPLGSSKTSGGVMKGFEYAQVYPGARIAVIRDTWPNLRDTTQKTFFEWFPDGVAGEYKRTEKTYYLYTAQGQRPAEIMFRAMDDKKDISNVLSLDLAAAWIDEPQGGLSLRAATASVVSEPGIDHDLFLAILGRLGRQRGYPGMAWLTGNPPSPSHWIAKEFGYSGHGKPQNRRKNYHLYLTDQQTNVVNLPPGYYERLEELFGAGTPMARRFINGEWIEFAQLNPFKREWILYYQTRPVPEDLYLVLGVDPAISQKDEAARTALVVVGQPLRGVERMTVYVMESEAGHWTPYEQADRILKLVQRYPRLRKLRLEDVGWQSGLKDIVEHEAQVRGIRLPFVELVKPKGDKLLRASRWSPLVESGRMLFGPEHTDLVGCLLAVPQDKTKWDPVDACGLAVGGLPQARPEKSRIAEPKSREQRQRVRSYAVQPRAAGDERRAPLRRVGPTLWHPAPIGTPQYRRRVRGYAIRGARVGSRP